MKEHNNPYEDMIYLSNPTSKYHPRMSLYDRSAQFSPFAALTGHEEMMWETARITEEKKELDEDTIEQLNRQIHEIKAHMGTGQVVKITYFLADKKKNGGAYVVCVDKIKKIDEYERKVMMMDNTVIAFDQIRKIDIETHE